MEDQNEAQEEIFAAFRRAFHEDDAPVTTSGRVAENVEYTKQYVHKLLDIDSRVERVDVGPSVAFYPALRNGVRIIEESLDGQSIMKGAAGHALPVPCSGSCGKILKDGDLAYSIAERQRHTRWEVIVSVCEDCYSHPESIRDVHDEEYVDACLEAGLELALVQSGIVEERFEDDDGVEFHYHAISEPLILEFLNGA